MIFFFTVLIGIPLMGLILAIYLIRKELSK